MKIFNFSNLVRDNVVLEERNFNRAIFSKTHSLNSAYKLADSVERCIGRTMYQMHVPAGCEAVCFCTGKDSTGKWEWVVLGTAAWKEKMIAAGHIMTIEG